MNLFILYVMSITMGSALVIASPAFKNNELIPSKYTCDGLNINPKLTIEEIPENAKSLVIIMDDPDAPGGTYCHWVIWDIPPRGSIEEGSAPGIQGKNSMRENKYFGPCPPSGIHHYHFKVYVLNAKLGLPPTTGKNELEKAMKTHILSSGELVGLYRR